VYELLNSRRNEAFKIQYENHKTSVIEAKKHNVEAVKFVDNLVAKKLDLVKKYLLEQNKGAPIVDTKLSKTLVVMDATGSMSGLLTNAKNTVSTMFERAVLILKENGLPEDCFQIQFCVYRNYNSPSEELLQASSWEMKPENLKKFMETISVSGGWGDEAVEIGLWHANQEASKPDGISQVILIGDMPANPVEVVQSRRDSKGEKYWRDTKFNAPTNYLLEVEKLKEKDIPVQAFYVKGWAKENFAEIASKSGNGGKSQFLDINSSEGSQMLTDFVTVEVLRNAGGNSNGDKLVVAYEKKFPKSYK
jgi:hypothetical protein